MSVFGGDSSWRRNTPGQYMLDVVQAAGSFGDSFARGFEGAQNRKQNQQQFDARMSEEKRQFDTVNPALPSNGAGAEAQKPAWLRESTEMMNGPQASAATPAATGAWQKFQDPTAALSAVFGARTMEDANEVVQSITTEKPDWFANRTFRSALQDGVQSVATRDRVRIASETAANRSIGNQILVKDAAEFNKRVGVIDPADRAQIIGMSRNEDGTVSAGQWQALSLAEQSMALRRENERKAAEVEAMARGDQQRTTITDRGVTKTFTPAEPGAVDAQPLSKTLPGGQVLTWMPGSKSLHVINAKKEEETPTAYQATQFAKFLQEVGDPSYTNFVEMAKGMFPGFKAAAATSAPTNGATKPATTSPTQFRKGQRAVQNGVTYEFDGVGWNVVK